MSDPQSTCASEKLINTRVPVKCVRHSRIECAPIYCIVQLVLLPISVQLCFVELLNVMSLRNCHQECHAQSFVNCALISAFRIKKCHFQFLACHLYYDRDIVQIESNHTVEASLQNVTGAVLLIIFRQILFMELRYSFAFVLPPVVMCTML